MERKRTKAILGGTLAVGLVFIVAGAAFACTRYYGKLTVEGNRTTSPANVTTSVNGLASGIYQWCDSPPVFSGTSDATREAYWGTKVLASNPIMTVTVAPADDCNSGGTNKLPGGNYHVGISEGYWDETDTGFADGDEENCHSLERGGSGGEGYGTIIDSVDVAGGDKGINLTTNYFEVDANGDGSERYDPNNSIIEDPGILRDAVNGAGGWNTVCVYMPQGQSYDQNLFNPANALNFRSI